MSENTQSLFSFRYIRRPELQALLGDSSRSFVEGLVAQGILPAPYKIGKRAVAWRSDELEAALAALPKIEDAYQRSESARKARQGA